MKLRALIVAAAFAAAAGSAFAQPPGGGAPPSPEMQAARAAMQTACAADIKSLCADAQGRAVNQCLRTNQSKVSADCAAAMAKMPAPPPRN